MPHLIDARPLIDTFAQTDPRMPTLVFALLDVYLDQGPFEFDAARSPSGCPAMRWSRASIRK